MRRGFTLLELLVVLGITTIVSLAAARAFEQGISYDQRVRAGRAELQKSRLLENRITSLLYSAYMTTQTDDTMSCFIGDTGQGTPDGTLQLPGSVANSLTFTTFGDHVPSRILNTTDDFETLNEKEGPQGGLAEVGISMTPVGQPTEVNGLYVRTQRPGDGDPTQGGYEEQLDADVTEIEFAFFDGTEWQTTWDTRTMSPKRLPAVVRVTYRVDGDDLPHVFTVRLPHSDVTADNPVVVEPGL